MELEIHHSLVEAEVAVVEVHPTWPEVYSLAEEEASM